MKSLKFIAIFILISASNKSIASPKEPLQLDNWSILQHDTGKGSLTAISAIGFFSDGETKLIYSCSYDYARNFKRSGLEILLNEKDLNITDGLANIEYTTDKDSGNFLAVHLTMIQNPRIPLENLLLWETLKASKNAVFSIKIKTDIDETPIYTNKNIYIDLRRFGEAREIANKRCGLNFQ